MTKAGWDRPPGIKGYHRRRACRSAGVCDLHQRLAAYGRELYSRNGEAGTIELRQFKEHKRWERDGRLCICW